MCIVNYQFQPQHCYKKDSSKQKECCFATCQKVGAVAEIKFMREKAEL